MTTNANNFPKHIMVVDDSDVQRQHMAELCVRLGFARVSSMSGGEEAVHYFEKGELLPEILIVDLEMPVVDGIQVLHAIVKLKINVAVIVASSRETALLSSVETMSQSLGIHLLAVVQKPLSEERLRDILQSYAPIVSKVQATNKPASPSVTLEDIDHALSSHQFIPYFQPKVTVSNAMIKGVEALIRWQHPERGLIAPFHFMNVVEDSKYIEPVTFEVLDLSLAQAKIWHAGGLRLTVSVNLSAKSLNNPQFADELFERVSASGIEPKYIIFEVTETAVMQDLGAALGTLARLRLKGFGLSIDDYGTGFSSMQQLSRISFTELKIDRSFVHQAHQRDHLLIMLESAVDMAKKLNLTVVAEGVEEEGDWKLLRNLGCDLAQGYLVAKPMPGDQLVPWIKQNHARLRGLSSQ